MWRRRQWHSTPVLLPENPMDGGAWWAAVHGVAKSRTRLSDFIFTFHFHALEKEMTTHSSVLAWRIPGTGEPGGLLSMGSHRVGHNWSDLAAAAAGNVNIASLCSICFLFFFSSVDSLFTFLSGFVHLEGIYPNSLMMWKKEDGLVDRKLLNK